MKQGERERDLRAQLIEGSVEGELKFVEELEFRVLICNRLFALLLLRIEFKIPCGRGFSS